MPEVKCPQVCVTWMVTFTWIAITIPYSGSNVTYHIPSEMNTSLGPVRGVTTTLLNTHLSVFYGIPYAKPPVGDLRFKRPLPPDPWNQTRDAFTMPNSCHCLVDEMFDKFEGVDMWNPNTPMSEDCLYLNVWAPKNGSPKKAIMVWIFGGTFTLGTSTLKVYDGKYLAAANDVIVVSMNYRIGPLGFLSYGDDAPGNAGLLDQAMAIQWVRDNAVNLGGDVNKITLFGESAGAASIGMHLLSPISRDLFNNAIMQSSTPLCYWALHSADTAMTRTKKLASIYKCDTVNASAMLTCLRKQDAQDMSIKAWSVTDYYFDVPFAPIVDKYFLLDTPSNLLLRNEVKNTSVLVGVMKNEGNYFLLYGITNHYNLTNNTPFTKDEYLDVVEKIAAPSNGRTHRAIAIEYEHASLPSDMNTYRDITDEISGDRAFKCPTLDFARKMSTVNSAVYAYSFEHRVSTNPWPEWTGVMHGYEIELIFGLPLDPGNNYRADEEVFSRRLMKMWTNFAKNGDPNTDGNHNWPKYNIDTQRFVHLNSSYIMKEDRGLRHRQCTFWREIVPLFADADTAPPQQSLACVNSSYSVLSGSNMVLLVTGSVVLGLHFTKHCAWQYKQL